MKRFFAASILRTATAVILLSILPAIFVVVGTGFSRYHDEILAVNARGERIVRAVALRQESMVEVIETLVQTLGQMPDVRDMNTVVASALFRSILATSQEYSNLFLLDAKGAVVASALPGNSALDFSSEAFFKTVMQRRAFGIGNVAVSPFVKQNVLYFGSPVLSEDGAELGAVCVALNLGRYGKALAGLVSAEEEAFYIVDGNGSLAVALPGSATEALGEYLDDEVWQPVRDSGETAGILPLGGGREGNNVFYRKMSLPGADAPYSCLIYVLPDSSLHGHARDALLPSAALFVVVTLLSLAAAIGLCQYAVRRPWQALFASARSVSEGDFDARFPENGVTGEIGTLGREFNTMAETMSKRDKELSAARDQVELSRTAKSEFLANMSHEIRTSMNAILGMAYLVLKTELSPQQRGYISKLLSAANALLRVINDILDFSKMEAGKMTMENISFSLRRIAGTVRSELAPRLTEKQLGFDLRIGHDVPDHLIGDPLRLSQALTVLVDDAVSRSERGAITLGCTVVEQDADRVMLQFLVRDAGVGLTPVQLMKMQELFERHEDDVPSTLDKQRLRLAIANRLFRMMGGNIAVSGVFGEGGAFSACARFGYAACEFRQSEKFFANKRALVVDRSEISRQDLVDVLLLFGFAVDCVPDSDAAAAAQEEARKEGAPFAVVFVDWRPPFPDMATAITRLRERTPSSDSPPIVLTTAPGRADLPASLDEFEIDALLPNPINESLVFDTLMNILGMNKASSFPMESAEEGKDLAGLSGLTILLAEDNTVNQQIAGEILESEGIAVTFADNGEDAARLVLENRPGTFSMVLMDLQMPVLDGFEATRRIREDKRFSAIRLPVIAMTAHSDLSQISACFKAGMNDHTGKPIIVDKFLATIRRWLPVREDSAETLAGAVRQLREHCGKDSEESRAAVEALLEKLAPVLHGGRVALLREAIEAREVADMAELLDSLGDMAHGFLEKDVA